MSFYSCYFYKQHYLRRSFLALCCLAKDVNFELYTNNDTLFLLYVIFFSHRGGHVYCYFVSYMFLLKQSCDYVLYGLSREFDFICTTQKKQLFCLCILSLTCFVTYVSIVASSSISASTPLYLNLL